MNSIIKRYIIVIILTLITAIIISNIENDKPIKNERLFQFPLDVGMWTGNVIPMGERIFESLETPYAILRDYQSPGKEIINFSIVWYDDREIAFHSAAACLGGIGDRVKEDSLYYLKAPDGSTYEIARLITDKFNIRKVVLYYYINDGYISGSQNKIRFNVVKKRLLLKRTSVAFVRIMASVKTNSDDTQAYIENFLLETIPLVDKYTNTNNCIAKK